MSVLVKGAERAQVGPCSDADRPGRPASPCGPREWTDSAEDDRNKRSSQAEKVAEVVFTERGLAVARHVLEIRPRYRQFSVQTRGTPGVPRGSGTGTGPGPGRVHQGSGPPRP